MLRDVPEMSGKYIVEDTDATTPMIENANAIVSISYEECTTSVYDTEYGAGHTRAKTYGKLASELASITQLCQERVVSVLQSLQGPAMRLFLYHCCGGRRPLFFV